MSNIQNFTGHSLLGRPSSPDLAAARRATCWVFLVCGIGTAAWAPMVPFAKARLDLDEARLGLILLALGGGALIAMPLTGLLIARRGSRRAILLSGLALALTLPGLALAASPLGLALALGFFGAAVGSMDVAANAQAIVIEKRSGRPLMSSFHGLFSVGGLAGALGMSGLLKLNLSLLGATLALSAVAVVLILWQRRHLLPPAVDAPAAGERSLALPRGAVAILGVLCFICFLAEGSILDWSAVFLRFSRNYDAASAGLGYAAFSVATAAGRLTGDRVTQWLGPVVLVRFGAILAALGFLLVVAVPWGLAALGGFTLIGLGIANVVPLLFSAAGRLPNVPPSVAIPAVTTLGYAGLLAGPALIGFVAQATSLALALSGVALLLLVVAASAPIARR